MRQLKVPAKYRLEQEQAFVNSCLGKRDIYHPVIEDGIRCQKILDAVLESSETKTWVEIK
jgi:predicted dehydrogenase